MVSSRFDLVTRTVTLLPNQVRGLNLEHTHLGGGPSNPQQRAVF